MAMSCAKCLLAQDGIPRPAHIQRLNEISFTTIDSLILCAEFSERVSYRWLSVATFRSVNQCYESDVARHRLTKPKQQCVKLGVGRPSSGQGVQTRTQ